MLLLALPADVVPYEPTPTEWLLPAVVALAAVVAVVVMITVIVLVRRKR